MARRTKVEALETREKLLGSALEVMCDKPFSRVSMSEIAERVGFSKGAAYWHFKNKHELLLNVVQNLCELVQRELFDGCGAQADLRDVREYFRRKMHNATRSKRMHMMIKLVNRRGEWPDDLRERVIEVLIARNRTEREMVERALVRARSDGRIGSGIPAGDLSLLITAVFQGLFIFHLHEFYSLDFAKYTDFIFDAFEIAAKSGGNSGEYPAEGRSA
ncbi:MAG: TetR family transcriptional regulator [Synergistaceae bacterium]|jgi:TetR/AcrR family acrAB operon transcriptional repressor|nr:TetR family transcriptional regulator [Synergistaceae bacterium]